MDKTQHQRGITLDKPEQIEAYRLLVLKNALKLEIKGMRMTRGRTAYAVIKSEFGLKGNKVKVLAQFEQLLREKGVLVDKESVDE